MSVIQTIRNKYGKIAGAVIAIALVGFIISDARNGTFGSFFGGRESYILKVDGIKIEPREYQERLKEYETLYTMFNKGRPIDDATRSQMNEQVIQMIVYETMVEKQCEKLGIQTTEDEKKELVYGANADPVVRQFSIDGNQIFVNRQTGQFDPGYVKGFEKQMNEESQKIDPTGKIAEQWEIVKNYVRRMSDINKYNSMFDGAAYVPVYEAKRRAEEQFSVASIKYVKVPFTSVEDVKVDDNAIIAYMKKNAALYETDQPTRNMEYVSFDIIPSSSDTARTLQALEDIRKDFETVKDKDMKSFVNNRSDDQNSYNGAFFNTRTFTNRNADSILNLPVGSVFGPYYENGSYRLTKVVDRQTLPDSVKMRHILVMTKQGGRDRLTDSAAKSRIDSAIAMVKSGVPFDSVVQIYTDDEGSKEKKGEYTWTLQQRPNIAKEFGDFIFEGKAGETKTVKVENDGYSGYHYIEILEQKSIQPSVKLATVAKNLVPSDSTVNAIYGQANEFSGKNPTAAEFDNAVKKDGFNIRIGDNIKAGSFSIAGLGSAREVVKWLFTDHKVGDISPVFQLGEQRYIVAKLTGIENKGLVDLTPMNRPVVEQKLQNEMKAAIISKKYTGAALDAIASGSGGQVQESDSVSLGATYIPGLGNEQKLVGYAFDPAFQPNTVSPGIPGQGGVYFITVLNRSSKPFDQSMMQVAGQGRQRDEYQLRNAIGQGLQQDLIKMSDVKYNVANF